MKIDEAIESLIKIKEIAGTDIEVNEDIAAGVLFMLFEYQEEIKSKT